MKQKYYLTTAIAYTSGKPHIGNTYEAILSDCLARFKRYQGYDVRFQTGTDEHGQKIEEKAKAANLSPKQFVDNVADQIKGIWDLVGVSYDKFIRTTDEYHEKQVQKIFNKLSKNEQLVSQIIDLYQNGKTMNNDITGGTTPTTISYNTWNKCIFFRKFNSTFNRFFIWAFNSIWSYSIFI